MATLHIPHFGPLPSRIGTRVSGAGPFAERHTRAVSMRWVPALPSLLRRAGIMGSAIVISCLIGTIAPAQEKIRYRWDRQLYGTLEQRSLLLYSGSAYHGKLTFGDLDGDGDAELLRGKADGRINLYENRGSGGMADWRLVKENIAAYFPVKGADGETSVLKEIFVGGFAAPALVDIDADGDQDLFVGSEDGRLFFFRNFGNAHLPTFELDTEQFVSRQFGSNLVPAFYDVNADRAPDLIIGAKRVGGEVLSGVVYLLLNQGDQRRAEFCVRFPLPDALPETPPPCFPTPRVLATISRSADAAPALADWDGDGDADLFVGTSDGSIAYFENRGTRFEPAWELLQRRFLAIDSGGFASPAFIDVNNDNNPDLIVGTSTNAVYLYTSKDTRNFLDIWQVSNNLLRVGRLGGRKQRVVITSGDLDGDGDYDLIIGDRDGNLLWLRNTGSVRQPSWQVALDGLLLDPARRNSAPHLADLDGDGDLDLLVGDRNGRLTMIRNKGDAKSPRWSLESTSYGGIDVGSNSSPITIDIDGDGDLDLFVGNSKGKIILYINEGTTQKPDFRLTATRFGDVAVGQSAAPSFFDWNEDGQPDLVVGNREGRLMLSINRSEPDSGLPRRWFIQSKFWERIQVDQYSAPHFSDFNGDGRADLLIGDGQGNIRLLYNLAMERIGASTGEGEGGEEEGAQPGPESMASAVTANIPVEETPFAVFEESQDGEILAPSATAIPEGPIPPSFSLRDRSYGGWQFDGKAVPAFADLDQDGDLDLIVGVAKGQLIYFRNDGDAKEARWEHVTDHFAGYEGAHHPSPIFADLDQNGLIDLVVGTEDGRLHLYEGKLGANGLTFTRNPNALSMVKVGRTVAPAVADINGDGRPDLILGGFKGRLLTFIADKNGPPFTFTLDNRRFLGLDVGLGSAPFVGDLDRDDTPDLLIGSDQGNLLNFKRIPPNVGDRTGWEQDDIYLKGLQFPAGTTPRLADIDGDGDQDLFVGTESGRIYFYRNEANPQGAEETE